MFLPNPLLKRAFICAAVVPFALLTGCALNSTGPVDTSIASLGGFVHGGQSPIQAATVNLYVTSASATGYGQAATLIGSSTTDVNGSFAISPSATSVNCPAGQQAYITSSGGYPSGSPALANTSILMMAALGDCANVSASTNVILNEVTTVAAAYALSGFTSTSLSFSVFQANVSAPAANRAATGTATAAAGLPHAFLNAASLASYAQGAANSQTAGITVGSSTVNGAVPLAEINALGNILQSCVNGATGNAQCVSLFSFTPSISGVVPTNTLQAMINLARNPYPSAAAMDPSTGLFSLASSSPAFQPTLTAAPPDWSLAVVYTNATALPAQYFTSMDANDTVYAGTSATSAKIAGLSAYGVATPTYAAAASGTSTRQIAPDALGNIWVANNGTLLVQYSATAGTITNSYTYTGGDVYGVAVDKANNVWVGNAVGTTPNVSELVSPGYTTNYTATAAGTFEPVAVFIDGNQNIWTADYFTNGTLASVLPNLTPAAAPTYTVTGTTVTPITTTFASSAVRPIGVVVDASGNAWYGIVGTCPTACPTGTPADDNTTAATGVEEVTPALTSSAITSLNPQPLTATTVSVPLGARATGIPAIDGAGALYLSDNLGAATPATVLGVHVYSTVPVTSSNTGGQVLSPPSGYLGCYLATASATVCGNVSTNSFTSATYNPREAAVDSTGSVWAGITTGGFTQFIGLGAPTWPLLATGKPGLSPGLSTVAPLP